MPTESILDTITINTPEQLERFLSALEKAKKLPKKKVIMSRPVVTVSNEELEKMIPLIKV